MPAAAAILVDPAAAEANETAAVSRDADRVAQTETPPELAPAATEPAISEPALAVEDSYIPPPPVHPEHLGAAEPFAAAALANGAEPAPKPKRRRHGLLELMAEVAGVASGERRTESKRRQRVEPVAGSIATKGAAKPAQPASTSQPALDGLDPVPRPGPTDAEGEMLDIPAFLRRQAN